MSREKASSVTGQGFSPGDPQSQRGCHIERQMFPRVLIQISVPKSREQNYESVKNSYQQPAKNLRWATRPPQSRMKTRIAHRTAAWIARLCAEALTWRLRNPCRTERTRPPPRAMPFWHDRTSVPALLCLLR